MEKYFKTIPQNQITERLQNLSIKGGSIVEKQELGWSVPDVNIEGQLNNLPSVLSIHDKKTLQGILNQYKNGVSFEEISLNFQISMISIQRILPLNKEAKKQRQKQVHKRQIQKEIETFCYLTDMQESQGKKMVKKVKKDQDLGRQGTQSENQVGQSVVNSSD